MSTRHNITLYTRVNKNPSASRLAKLMKFN